MTAEDNFARLVDNYRRHGYDVTVHPTPDQLPPFARDFRVEILAHRAGEHVLVATRKNHAAFAADHDLPDYAEVTNAQPNWRFDFAILEATPPKGLDMYGATPYTPADIARTLARAEALVRDGQHDLALVAAWAGLEAAARWRLRDQPALIRNYTAADFLGEMRASVGDIDNDEYEQLQPSIRVRDQIVHGYTPPAGPPTDLAGVVRTACVVARRFVAAEATAAAA